MLESALPIEDREEKDLLLEGDEASCLDEKSVESGLMGGLRVDEREGLVVWVGSIDNGECVLCSG